MRLLIANLKRRKIRTILTAGSFAVALFLYGLLATLRSSFNQGVEIAGVDRLTIINKISLIMPLPLAYREQLKQISGVTAVTYANWFGGIYQDESNFFPQFAIDHETWITMFQEYTIPPEQLADFNRDKEGCIVGRKLLDRFGWKIGDRIPIQGTVYGGTWEFNIRGVYDGTRPDDDTSAFWFRFDYFDERRAFEHGTVGWYTVKLSNPDDAAAVAKEIDQRFANSASETTTQTEQAFASSFVKQMGNIELLLLSIGSVVFFTLLLVTGNTMAIAVRERVNELAVLKAIGYPGWLLLALVLAESLTLAIAGGGFGLLLAKLFTLGGDPTGGMLGSFRLQPMAMLYGAAMIVAVGIAAGLIPAVSAMRLRVVNALRRV